MGTNGTAEIASRLREILAGGKLPIPSSKELDGVFADTIEVFHNVGRGIVDGQVQMSPHDRAWYTEDMVAQSEIEEEAFCAAVPDIHVEDGRVYVAEDAVIMTCVWRGTFPDQSEFYTPICVIWEVGPNGVTSNISYMDSSHLSGLYAAFDPSLILRHWRQVGSDATAGVPTPE